MPDAGNGLPNSTSVRMPTAFHLRRRTSSLTARAGGSISLSFMRSASRPRFVVALDHALGPLTLTLSLTS